MTTHITINDLRRLNACPESVPLAHWLLGRVGSWSGEWTVDLALELARLDGAGPRIGALGWLERRDLVPRVLSGADLRMTDMINANLRGTDLIYADLSGVDLTGADLTGANLEYADLRGAKLIRANLHGAVLTSASLIRAHLSGANLSNAALIVTDLHGADLRDANLSWASLTDANLTDANLSGAKGLPSASEWIEQQAQDAMGVIVYKTFGAYHSPPPHWRIEPGSVLTETVNPCRTTRCGSGINVGSLEYVRARYEGPVWRCRIAWRDLADLVVPYSSDALGQARCARVTLIEEVTT
jgi:uncharacterized protein YjbI with pentapeptide repeats